MEMPIKAITISVSSILSLLIGRHPTNLLPLHKPPQDAILIQNSRNGVVGWTPPGGDIAGTVNPHGHVSYPRRHKGTARE